MELTKKYLALQKRFEDISCQYGDFSDVKEEWEGNNAEPFVYPPYPYMIYKLEKDILPLFYDEGHSFYEMKEWQPKEYRSAIGKIKRLITSLKKTKAEEQDLRNVPLMAKYWDDDCGWESEEIIQNFEDLDINGTAEDFAEAIREFIIEQDWADQWDKCVLSHSDVCFKFDFADTDDYLFRDVVDQNSVWLSDIYGEC